MWRVFKIEPSLNRHAFEMFYGLKMGRMPWCPRFGVRRLLSAAIYPIIISFDI